MTSSLFNRLEAQDFSAFSSPPSGKSESRGWSSLHYACQSRLISGIISSLSLRRPESLTDLGKDQNRACDLLPVPELSHFNLYSFGFASDYQLGYAKEKQLIPKKIDFHSLQDQFDSVIQIASYKYHSLFISSKREVWAFGSGRKGVLGTGHELYSIFPVNIGLKAVIQVAVGEMHSVCLTEDRNVFVWGDNSAGQVLGSSAQVCMSPVYVKYFKNIYVEKIVSGKNHVAVFTGEKVYSWGANNEKQLMGNAGGVVVVQASDLQPNAAGILDVEAYENSTAVLLTGNEIVKSGVVRSIFHIPASSPITSICISAQSIHGLSSLGVLYSFSLNGLNKNTHYKMFLNRVKMRSIFSGFFAAGVDFDRNLWNLDKESGLIKEISCVNAARLNENFSLIVAGVEKIPFPLNNSLMTLFEIAEERVFDSVNINTACELLRFSETFNCEKLRWYCEYFIARNLRSFICLANWEYFSVLEMGLAEGLQRHVCVGSLPKVWVEEEKEKDLSKLLTQSNLISPNLQKTLKSYAKDSSNTSRNKPIQNKRKKTQQKPRALSGLDSETIPICKSRPRSGTEPIINYIPPAQLKPTNEFPIINKSSPWGSSSNLVVPFGLVQAEAKDRPLIINKWENPSTSSLQNFEEIQEVEQEDKDIEEALILIALMESKSN